MDLDDQVAGCAASHQLLLTVIDELTETQCHEPSLLVDWSRGHVLSHLARNAMSHVHLLDCAQRGETGEQYPGGYKARNAGINDHANDTRDELVKAVRSSIYALEGAWAGASAQAWAGSGQQATGAVIPMHDIVFLRWREVVIHLTDLDVGYDYGSWPELYVRMELGRQVQVWASRKPMGLTILPPEALALAPALRLAWLVGRAHPDGLPQSPGL
ncbi:MAG: maleylpyruvate isomerase family mycothiol-dependent enzyme [Ilumatobacteraceae bacterium]|nr:maleylpyruvate isomerase family mycothiol-dependent enzyme [Ilumatobacteraceae bacterium]